MSRWSMRKVILKSLVSKPLKTEAIQCKIIHIDRPYAITQHCHWLFILSANVFLSMNYKCNIN